MITETIESPPAALDVPAPLDAPAPLEVLATVVDGLAGEQVWQFGDEQLVSRMDGLGTMIDRLQGVRLWMIAEVEHRTVYQDQDWTAADRLTDTDRQPLRHARATVKQAERLHRFPVIGEALCAGRVTAEQACAISCALDELSADVAEETVRRAQQEMVGHADRFDPAALRRLGNHLAEVLCPNAVEDRLGQQLSRQEAQARRDRFLDWKHTGDGSVSLRGKLPVLEGETVTALIDSYAQRGHGGSDAELDPRAEAPTAGRRRADALIALVQDVQGRRLAPTVSGDRPRAVITLEYQDLLDGIRGATLIGSGESISPGTARRVACSGELVPAVLGGRSVVLDMARPVRLFTGLLRQALIVRDGGCVFPNCDAPPGRCEAHHVQPWWAGGRTELGNGVLLCRHHHDLAEPDPHAPPGSRWTIRLDDHGLPEVIPPTRVDPDRRPRQHIRYTERRYHRRT